MGLELSSLFILIPMFCTAGLGVIFALLIGLFLVYQSIETLLALGGWTPAQHPWLQLAQQYQFDFKHGPQLTGVYRGHKLHLKLVKEKYQNTVLTLSANPAQAPPTPIAPLAQTPSSLTELVQMMAPHGLPELWWETISIDLRNCRVIYQKEGSEPKPERLQLIFDLASDLLEICPQIVASGGAIVPALTELSNQHHPLQYVAIQCLHHISQVTRKRLGTHPESFLCSKCLVHCTQLPIRHPWQRQSFYYGCRQCGQSQQFLEIKDRWAVVVLDESSKESIVEQPGQLRINWFAHPQPFDFDEVEIIQADNEAVERFAVQLGNDTDPVRRPRYRQMPCRIATNCSLSANTLKILQRTFGEVGSTPNVSAKHLRLEQNESTTDKLEATFLSTQVDNRPRPEGAISIASKPGRNVAPPRAALDSEEFSIESGIDL